MRIPALQRSDAETNTVIPATAASTPEDARHVDMMSLSSSRHWQPDRRHRLSHRETVRRHINEITNESNLNKYAVCIALWTMAISRISVNKPIESHTAINCGVSDYCLYMHALANEKK